MITIQILIIVELKKKKCLIEENENENENISFLSPTNWCYDTYKGWYELHCYNINYISKNRSSI